MICIVSLLTILIIQIECKPHHDIAGTEILNLSSPTDNDYLEDNPIDLIFPTKASTFEAAIEEYKINNVMYDKLGEAVSNNGSNVDKIYNEDKDGSKVTQILPEELTVQEYAENGSTKDTRSVSDLEILVRDILEDLEKAYPDETEEETPTEIVVIDSDCEGDESVKCSRSADAVFVAVPPEPEYCVVPVHGRARFACHFGPEPNYPSTSVPSEPFYGPPYMPPFDIWYGPPYDPYNIAPDEHLYGPPYRPPIGLQYDYNCHQNEPPYGTPYLPPYGQPYGPPCHTSQNEPLYGPQNEPSFDKYCVPPNGFLYGPPYFPPYRSMYGPLCDSSYWPLYGPPYGPPPPNDGFCVPPNDLPYYVPPYLPAYGPPCGPPYDPYCVLPNGFPYGPPFDPFCLPPPYTPQYGPQHEPFYDPWTFGPTCNVPDSCNKVPVSGKVRIAAHFGP